MEIQQPIRLHPFAIHDYALKKCKDKTEIMAKTKALYALVKKVNGDLITVFSNELLGDTNAVDWKDLYVELIRQYHV